MRPKRAHSATRVLLQAAFFAAAFTWVLPHVVSVHLTALSLPEWVVSRYHLYLWIPLLYPAVYSMAAYDNKRALGPLCMGMAAMGLGLLRTESSELGRGMLQAAAFALACAIAVLVARTGGLRSCMCAWTAGVLASLAVTLLQAPPNMSGRFGVLTDMTGSSITNPNVVGGHCGIAAVFLLHVVSSSDWRNSLRKKMLAGGAFLLCLYCLLLTGSRGAVAALLAALLIAGGMRIRKRPELIAFSLLALLTAMTLLLLLDSFMADRLHTSVVEAIGRRILVNEENELDTFGARTNIWHFGLQLIQEDINWLVGVGTGGSDKALGAYFEFNGRAFGRDGIWRLYSHNMYLEWLLSFGILGLPVAAWAGITVLRRSWVFDRKENGILRVAMLAFVAVYGITGVTYRELFWVPVGAIFWASILPAETLFRKRREAAIRQAEPVPYAMPAAAAPAWSHP